MEQKVTFFLGANTPSGFYSLYDQMLDPAEARRVFLLKGGAGCGKSSLMKRVAASLEEVTLELYDRDGTLIQTARFDTTTQTLFAVPAG